MVGAESSWKGGKRGRKQQEAATAAALIAMRQDQNGGLRITEPDSNAPVIPSSLEIPNVRNEDLSNRGKRARSKARDKDKGKGFVEVEFNERSQNLQISEPDSNAPVVPSSQETPNVRNEDLSNRGKRAKSKARVKNKGKGFVEVEFNERSQNLQISEPDSNAPVVPSSQETPNVRNGDFSNRGKRRTSKAKRPIEVEFNERTQYLGISEPDSDAPVVPFSPETLDVENENLSSTDKRGKSKPRDKGKRKGPVEVEFNERNQYVGEYAAEFASFLGETARRFVPLIVPSWYGDALTDNLRIQIWTHVTSSYIVDECRKKVIFQKMAELWRNHKCVTLKKIRQDIGKVGLRTAATKSKPSNVHSLKEWLEFIKSSMNPAYRAKCEKFKDMRDQKSLVHRTSRTSFACIEHDLKKRSDTPVGMIRTNVWLRGYESKKKNEDDADVEDPEIVKKVKKKVADQANSSHRIINDDIVAQVLAPERRGRVQGYGFGARPSNSRVTNLEQEVKDLKMLVESLVGQDKGEICSANINVQTSPTQIRSSSNDTSSSNKRKQVDEGVEQGAMFMHDEQDRGEKSSENINVHTSPIQIRVSNNDTPTSKKRKQVDERVEQAAMFAPQTKKVFLLNWFDEEENIVAIGDLQSQDPREKVHCVPLGRGCWKVWVRDVFEDIPLYRPTSEFSTLVGAEGSTVAWPTTSITLL